MLQKRDIPVHCDLLPNSHSVCHARSLHCIKMANHQQGYHASAITIIAGVLSHVCLHIEGCGDKLNRRERDPRNRGNLLTINIFRRKSFFS